MTNNINQLTTNIDNVTLTTSASSQIEINLAHANTWTAQQTFTVPIQTAQGTSISANTNTAVGTNAMNAATGLSNSAFGNGALQDVSGSSNCAFGYNALAYDSSGGENSAFGWTALKNVTTGSNNCAFGNNAGNAYTSSESNNITIGSGTTGTAGESNKLRIGNVLTGDLSTNIMDVIATTGIKTTAGAATTVSVGASPYTYTNSSTSNQQIFIQGGTVSAISFNPNGGTGIALSGLTDNVITMRPNDTLTITYTAAPTVNTIQL